MTLEIMPDSYARDNDVAEKEIERRVEGLRSSLRSIRARVEALRVLLEKD